MNWSKMQLRSTLFAVAAPLAHFTGLGYMSVLLAAGAMLPLTVLAGDGLKRITKPEAVLELLWVGLIMGTLLRVSGTNWPGEKTDLVVPTAILLLAVISGDTKKSVRSCSTLFWIAAIPAVLAVIALAGKVEPDLLTPEPAKWTGVLIAALLYPSLNGVNKGVKIKTAILTAVVAGILATIVQGGLGRAVSEKNVTPLYELGRCVGNGGFEIIVSVVLTLGWYGFASMGMRSAEAFGNMIGLSGIQSRIGAAILAGTVILFHIIIEDWILISGCLILWILIPILHPEK